MTDRTVRVRVVADIAGYGPGMRTATTETTRFGAAATGAGRGVHAMGGEAGRARGALATIGESAKRSAEMVGELGLILAGAALVKGVEGLIEQGNEYNDSLNKFQEVTRATGAQMNAAGKEAQALGADLKLPQASAAEAGDAMVELAKAGLSAQDAITATRGTIQLASAARTDVATAARIEGDSLDQFGLKASDATMVADTLANVANNTSGELTDLSYALKYIGPPAHAMGISIQQATTAIGLLGKSGIIGETAGTALRGMLVNMSKPTAQMKKGLAELNIQAYDSQGNFKGLRYVVGQLASASENLTTQQFTAASAMAFGKPALSASVALAHQGTLNWDAMATAIGRQGGAAALAAAESKGLGGAMRGLGKELTSTFLQLYLGISPALEKVTRGLSGSVAGALPYLKRGIKDAEDLWDIYGPGIEAKLARATRGVEAEAEGFTKPIEGALVSLAAGAVPVAIGAVHNLGAAFHNVESGLAPVASGAKDLVRSVTSDAGALGTFSGRVSSGVSLLGSATSILGPIGSIVGGLAHDFAGLPGPVQLSVISMLALRPFRSQFQGMQTAVVGYGRSAVNSFNGVRGAIQTQEILAQQAGVSLGRYGAAFAAVEARVPVIRDMSTSFRSASSAITTAGGRLAGFRGAAAGAGAALSTGAKAGLLGGLKGLYSFLGGPFGVAMAAAMIGLDLLAKKQQEAAAATAAHEARISSLTQALADSNGQMSASVRASAVQTLADAKLKDGKTSLLDTMSAVHVSALQLTNSYLGQGESLASLQKNLQAKAKAEMASVIGSGANGASILKTAGQYQTAADAVGTLMDEYPNAQAQQKALAAAIAGGGGAAVDATNPTGRLKDAIATLGSAESDADTKATALHTALELLSGGALDVQAAMEQVHEAQSNVNSMWQQGVDHSKGYGKALLQVDGSLNTTSTNGQQLWTNLQALNQQTAAGASASYDYARAQGKSVPAALSAAESGMKSAYKTAVTAAEKFGLTADQAKVLAIQMGFIPSSLAITLGIKDLDPTTADLMYVQGLAASLPKGKTITINALTAEATKDIEKAGIKVTEMPGGRQIKVTVSSDAAEANLNAVLAKLGAVHSKTATVTVDYRAAGNRTAMTNNADGGLYSAPGIRAFAGGSEDHRAQIAPGGAMRLWAEPETEGEAYIPLAGSKRARSTDILEKVAGRFGYRLEKYADGGIRAFADGGFTYATSDPVQTLGVETGMSRYGDALDKLTNATDDLRNATTKAEKAAAHKEINKADAALGLKAGTTSTAFNLASYQKELAAAAKANSAWESQLATIGKKAGGDVEDTLRSMGTDGTALVAALSKASTTQFNAIVANLKSLAPTAAATLADYTKQFNSANSAQAAFQANLLKLAGMGDSALASQLAAQGDDTAASIAAAAVNNAAAAATANAAATTASNLLSSDDITNAITLLGVLRSHPGATLADVMGAGLDLGTVKALVPKIGAQLSALPAMDTATFLAQLAGQSGVTAMARGGILPNGPATVIAGEPGTGGEAWIPLGPGNRGRSTGLLSQVAGMFGYQLTPVGMSAGGSRSSGPTHVVRQNTVHLHGAKQTAAEQAADISRHMMALS